MWPAHTTLQTHSQMHLHAHKQYMQEVTAQSTRAAASPTQVKRACVLLHARQQALHRNMVAKSVWERETPV